MTQNTIKLLSILYSKVYTRKYKFKTSFEYDNISHIRPKIFQASKELVSPKFIYKYFNNDEHNLDSLEKKYFYLSHPKDFNDPFDCLNNLPYSKNNLNINNLGVCCFSKVKNSSPMWGNYTNNYKGFCLKVDLKKLKNNISKNNFFLKVIYENSIKNLIEFKKAIEVEDELNKYNDFNFKQKNHILKVVEFFYRTTIKSKSWNYEKEYRFISPSITNNDRNLKFNINCIEEIYIGYKMKSEKPEFYRKLTDILKGKYKHVKIFIVKPDTVDLKLNFLPIKQ